MAQIIQYWLPVFASSFNGTILFSVEVEANNEVEAMEFAYDQMEMDTYAEPTMIKETK